MSNSNEIDSDRGVRGIGVAQTRSEDARLLTGRGTYAADVLPENVCHAHILRSPHAHARIRAIHAGSSR